MKATFALAELRAAQESYRAAVAKQAKKNDALSDTRTAHAHTRLVRAMNAARDAGIPNSSILDDNTSALMSPRAIISAVIARRGLQKRALAAKVPALGKLPAYAGSNLSRYLSGVRDMHGETVGAILAALGLVIACRTCRRDAVECECREHDCDASNCVNVSGTCEKVSPDA